ncbi:MAG: ATP-binding protein [Planctomycetes bacterium]|nr:ATP-binding protein [Planctomycetota bacterium]
MVGSVFAIPREDSKGVHHVAGSPSSGIAPRDRTALPLGRFIAGPENALAKLAASSVGDQWVRFNPLFISGPAGFGKTHLLHCLLAASQVAYADLRSLWLTGADYARAIANGIDIDSLDEVRDAHRSVDLLMLDGLHELAAKTHAQQELIHTLDYLVASDCQVVITSLSALDELDALLPTLSSRLSRGLQIPIVPPTATTRSVILNELAQQNDVVIPTEVSQRLTSDARRQRSKPLLVHDLCAAITELRCLNTHDGDCPPSAVERIVSRTDSVREVTAKDINKRVAKYFNVTVRELTGDSRRKTVVRARALSVYLIRTLVGSSFQTIGRNLGGRDHSTVMHAFGRAKEWLDDDVGFARAATALGVEFD